MTKRNNSTMATTTAGARFRRPLPPSLRLALAGLVAVIGLVGCAGTVASPAVSPSAVSSVTASAIASSTPGPIETPTSQPSPTTPPPLTFVATGSMHTARSRATATLLENGKVLIAGGTLDRGPTQEVYATAELYDPATGKFSPTGSMSSARSLATAALLLDGRVLIAGGEGCSKRPSCDVASDSIQELASAETYDPATGKFTATGSMTDATVGENAVNLPDGRVLIAGFGLLAEVYDPSSGKFAGTTKQAGLQGATDTLLPNGKVLMAGGADMAGLYNGAGLYDVASGKFTTVSLALPPDAPMVKYQGAAISRAAPTAATLLKDGRVLLFGGGYLETYDPASGACADAGFISPAGKWNDASATLMADGRVLYEGGELVEPVSGDDSKTNTAVLFDPTGGPSRTGSMRAARVFETATLLPDGSVLVAGGQDDSGNPLAPAELFKP